MDPVAVAEEIGLRHVDPQRLPIERRRHGTGFRYLSGGDPVGADQRGRIEALAIPPAWEDVRIAANDTPHILAMGTDDAGRTQYRYHPRFREEAERLKFARLAEVGSRMSRLRSTVVDALGDEHDRRDVAAVIGLIDTTAIRVGSTRYAEENGTVGASTLQRRHVDVDDPLVRLAFTAKGGVDRDLRFEQPVLAHFLSERLAHLDTDEQPVFSGPDGGAVTGSTVGRALSDWSGTPMTAKELRTWSASARMVDALMDPAGLDVELDDVTSSDDPVLVALDVVADHLGNTRAVARSSYVAPVIVTSFENGRLESAWRRSRRSAVFSRAEQTLRKVLTV